MEASPRSGHCSAAVEGKVYVWGGRTEAYIKEKTALNSTLHVFDQLAETWNAKPTTGTPPPPGIYLAASASSGHHLYQYGGEDESYYHDSFYCLDIASLQWTELPSGGAMKKSGYGVVTYGEQLFLFGGFGIPTGPIQAGAEFIGKEGSDIGEGWTNEIHVYDLKGETWSSPTVIGTRPPPCDEFSLTMIDDHHAVLFGGHHCGRGRCNDVYILDLAKTHWGTLNRHEGQRCPVGRSAHAAVCLGYGGDHPQLLVSGGWDKDGKVLSDLWMLNLQSGRWREFKDPRLQPRSYHSATAISLCPGLTEVTLFGGSPKDPESAVTEEEIPQVANTTVLRFEETGQWELIDVAGIGSGQLGTAERLKIKRKLIASHGPPQYILDDEYVKAKPGESPTLHFTMTSQSDDTKHSIHNEEGKLIRRFKASLNLITLRDVEVSDSGMYTISCRDAKGLEGKATFELKITPDNDSSATKKSSGHNHQTIQPPTSNRNITLPLQMRYLQLIKWKGPQGEGRKFELMDRVSSGWRRFGTRINLTKNNMDAVQAKAMTDINLCWENVMQAWLDGQGQEEYPLTWDGLFEMLEDVKYAGVVPELKEALYMASSNKH